jgi:Ser/Thr protein kinase RdoA (MazF antagonist)
MLAEPQEDLLQIAPPLISDVDAERIAREYFGLEVHAKQLTGERDLNFLMSDRRGVKRVLKIANAGEQAAILDFQISALRHLASTDCATIVPQVIPALSGETIIQTTDRTGRPHLAYMLSYINGTPLAGHEALQGDVASARAIGMLLGRLDMALAGFRHQAQARRLQWDLSLAADLRPKLMSVDELSIRNLALEALDRFEENVLPGMNTLPRQVIHNDLNPHNLILASAAPFSVAGVIDFGDMLEAPRANDVAVAASYHFHQSEEAAASLVTGYQAVVGMSEEEMAMVPLLIGARSVLTIAITSWRAQLYPENRVYIQRNRPAAVRTLAVLSGDGCERLHDNIHLLCEQDLSRHD